ncbi:MAG TPA: hypothetical protein PK198_26645 [Saprospiraceae bacterium]|nr:hypothetical protein [Saprospiraceae bacterium]HRK83878.1 hypothetical protein [Saprospiraceae bacterium]
MKALLLIISTTFLLQHPAELPDCDKSEAIMRIALNALLSREMIAPHDNTLNIIVSEEWVRFLPAEIKTDRNWVQVLANQASVTDVILTNVLVNGANGAKVFFRTSPIAGYQYSGTISLKCLDGAYVFDAIHYVSEIE